MAAWESVPGAAPSGAWENAPSEGVWETALDLYTAAPKAAASVLSGTVAGIAGGLAGIAAAPFGKGAETVEKVSDALTYRPKGRYAEALTDIAQWPFRKWSELARKAGEVVEPEKNPLLSTAVETVLSMEPMMFGVRGPKAAKLAQSASAASKGAALEHGFPIEKGESELRPLSEAEQVAADGAAIKDTATARSPNGVRKLFYSVFGEPGEHRNLFNPIRNQEQANVARIERWASGEGYAVRQAFPDKAAREKLTMGLVSGDLAGLSPEQTAVAQRLRTAYDQMGAYAMEAERLDGLRQNYSPQIWDIRDTHTRRMIELWRSAKERGALREDLELGGGSGSFSPFLLQRAIADVREGMRIGLKPKSLDAADLFETYAKSMGRAVERGKTFQALSNLMSEDGTMMVMAREQAPRDYVAVRNPELEGLRVHPDIAPAVKVMLESREPGAIAGALQTAAYTSKRALVSYSFFHPKALLEAYGGSGGNPLTAKGAIDAALNVYREGGVGDALDKGLQNGLKIGAPLEDIMGRERFQGILERAEQIADKVGAGKPVKMAREIDESLQRATWNYVHTGLKIDTFLRTFENQMTKNAERLERGETNEAAIARQAAEFTNGIYGGLNWERMIDKFDTPLGRKMISEITSQAGRRWLQTLTFAPDWLVSTVSSWTNAVTPGELNAVRAALARRYLATSAIYASVIGNGLNYALTGHYMLENKSAAKDANRLDDMKSKTEVQFGDGRRMNIMKHFLEVPHAATDPFNWALGKTNPIVVGEPIEQIANKQWLSTHWSPPITQKKDSTAKAVGERAAHAAKKFVPIPGQSIMQQGPAGLGGFFGFPVYGMTERQKREAREERSR